MSDEGHTEQSAAKILFGGSSPEAKEPAKDTTPENSQAKVLFGKPEDKPEGADKPAGDGKDTAGKSDDQDGDKDGKKADADAGKGDGDKPGKDKDGDGEISDDARQLATDLGDKLDVGSEQAGTFVEAMTKHGIDAEASAELLDMETKHFEEVSKTFWDDYHETQRADAEENVSEKDIELAGDLVRNYGDDDLQALMTDPMLRLGDSGPILKFLATLSRIID